VLKSRVRSDPSSGIVIFMGRTSTHNWGHLTHAPPSRRKGRRAQYCFLAVLDRDAL